MAKKCSNPNCLYTNSDSSHYCVKCGHPLEERNWTDSIFRVRPKDQVKIEDPTKKEYTVVNKDEYNALIEACNESDKKINDLNRRLRLSNRSWYEKLNEKLKKWWDDHKIGIIFYISFLIIVACLVLVILKIQSCIDDRAKSEIINSKESVQKSQEMQTIKSDSVYWEKYDKTSYSLKTSKGKRIMILADGYIPYPFNEGLAAVVYNDKVAYYDVNGMPVIPMEKGFKKIPERDPSFIKGMARVSFKGSFGIIDKNGKFIKTE